MNETLYAIDTELEAAKAGILAKIHPKRAQTMHIFAHNHTALEAEFDPIEAAREYAQLLGLQTSQIHYFSRIHRNQAEKICTDASEFDIIMSDPQMPHKIAAQLAATWLMRFGNDTVFFANGEPPQTLSRAADFDRFRYSLFFTDREAGVIAVSPTKAGIFWSAENS